MIQFVSHKQPMCPCGRPLHYSSPLIQSVIEDLVRLHGLTITVVTAGGTFLVPRHYIALHGIQSQTLPAVAKQFGFQQVEADAC